MWRARGGRIGLGTVGVVLVWGVRKSRDPSELGDLDCAGWVRSRGQRQFCSGRIQADLSVSGRQVDPGLSFDLERRERPHRAPSGTLPGTTHATLA